MTSQDKQTLIELTTPEQYPKNGELFPPITHCRIVNISIETPRPIDDKPGRVSLWVAKGYLDGPEMLFYEAPGLAGADIIIEEPELWDFGSTLVAAGAVMPEMIKTASQYLIDKGYIQGTVVVLEPN